MRIRVTLDRWKKARGVTRRIFLQAIGGAATFLAYRRPTRVRYDSAIRYDAAVRYG
jgi:hypothetical protein